MTIYEIVLLLSIGLVAGIFSGALGVGGAIIIIPALVFFLGMTQKQAQGTSIAVMLAPIGILAFLQYYKNGYVNIKYAIFVIIAFTIGAYFGSIITEYIPDKILRKIFGGFLIIVAIKMIIEK
ncbi:MAG: sulfite exporter TauE/SafE family protein [Bacteroidales bacterium]